MENLTDMGHSMSNPLNFKFDESKAPIRPHQAHLKILTLAFFLDFS